jgi:hypothetical protein
LRGCADAIPIGRLDSARSRTRTRAIVPVADVALVVLGGGVGINGDLLGNVFGRRISPR